MHYRKFFKKIGAMVICLVLVVATIASSLCMSFAADAVEGIHCKDKDGKDVILTDFLDTKGHWAHDAILKANQNGLIAGGPDGRFNPNAPITRGDICVILDRMFGLTTTTYNMYSDLNPKAYYHDAMLRCIAAEFLTGTSSTTVAPTSYATREQVATILYRVFDLEGGGRYTGFKDDGSISSWSRSAVSTLNSLGYMRGSNGYCRPQSNITRAEFATLLGNIAQTYIPKKDTLSLGSDFRANFPTNVVTSRDITLNGSTVGRDIFITNAAKSIGLVNSTVNGRIVTYSKVNIELSQSTVDELVLKEGKSSVTGLSNSTLGDVYVGYYASGSTFDGIPKYLTLEPGAVVEIKGDRYENSTAYNKTYKGTEILNDMAEDDGFTEGSPQIASSTTFVQSVNNRISVKNVRVTKGTSDIVEVGVVWQVQDSKENTVNPSVRSNSGKSVYKSSKYDEAISFNVGTISKPLVSYRVYAKDKNGLVGYSAPVIFNRYDYDIKFNLSGADYPKFSVITTVIEGSNVPKITSLNILYAYDNDENKAFNEAKDTVMRAAAVQYSDTSGRTETDVTKFNRFDATVTGTIKTTGLGSYYVAPDFFGYQLQWADGTIDYVMPKIAFQKSKDASAISELITGSIDVKGQSVYAVNNTVTANLDNITEVGIVSIGYDGNVVPTPSSDWNKQPNLDIPVPGNPMKFTTLLPVYAGKENIAYAVYAVVDGKYNFGTVATFLADISADVAGPSIRSVEAIPLNNIGGKSKVLCIVRLSDATEGRKYIDTVQSPFCYCSKNGEVFTESTSLSLLEYKQTVDFNTLYFTYEISKGDYSLGFRLYDTDGNKSNVVFADLSTDSLVNIGVANKSIISSSEFNYDIVAPSGFKVDAGTYMLFEKGSDHSPSTVRGSVSVDMAGNACSVTLDSGLTMSSDCEMEVPAMFYCDNTGVPNDKYVFNRVIVLI